MNATASRNTQLAATPIMMESRTAINKTLAVWLSGNASVSINVVTLRRARLVPGWMTAFGGGGVNYLGM